MAAAPVMGGARFWVWLLAVLLVLMTIAVYGPVTRYGFVDYDDPQYVTDNPRIQGGLNWEGVKWAFCNPVAYNWHPITVLSHMLDCQLFGLKPWGHHLTSVLLHVVNTLLVFLLLRRLTGAMWRSLLVAALFALHPLHVESVAWVAERKDVVSTLFWLLTLWAYAAYVSRAESRESNGGPQRQRKREAGSSPVSGSRLSTLGSRPPGTGCYILALVFFACGLMSKPMLVTLPFVLLLLDYWPLNRMQEAEGRRQEGKTEEGEGSGEWRVAGEEGPTAELLRQSDRAARARNLKQDRTFWRLALEKWPFFALAAVISVVTFMVQKRTGAMEAGEHLDLGARSGNALVSYCRYLGKLFWPTDLAVLYPHPGHWQMEKLLLAGALLVGVSAALLVSRRRYPFMLMGWLWYCGTLVPVIGLVQVGHQAMADRYAYIPSLGVLILAIWGAYELSRRWRYEMIVLPVGGAVAVAICIGLTRWQLGYWRDSETLFRHAIDVTENNYLAHNSLGNALLKQGQADEAIREYQEAIRLKPDYAGAHNNLGTTLYQKGQIDEAVRQFQEAIRLKPDEAEAHFNLGAAFGMRGQADEAIREYEEVIRLKPNYAEVADSTTTSAPHSARKAEPTRRSGNSRRPST